MSLNAGSFHSIKREKERDINLLAKQMAHKVIRMMEKEQLPSWYETKDGIELQKTLMWSYFLQLMVWKKVPYVSIVSLNTEVLGHSSPLSVYNVGNDNDSPNFF